MTRRLIPYCSRPGLLMLLAVALGALATGCATSQEKRTTYRFDCAEGVASKEFERALVALGGGLLPGNRAVLLNNGEQFLPSIIAAIEGARSSINIELYIFAKGTMANTVIEALCRRASAGIEVRVLVDALGERLSAADKETLAAAGVKFEIYKPTKLRSIAKVSDRTHRKLIIVDGRIGFTGGLAFDDRWLGDARGPAEWRDCVVRVEGPVVLQMQRLFLENWLYTTGEFLSGEAQFPVVSAAGQANAQAIGSSRTSQLSLAKLHYYMPIQAAQHEVWIENAYFLPDEDIREALCAAARRGVDVRVVVPGKHTDAKAVRYAGRGNYRELLEAGVRIYEFRPTMLHNKVMLVDGVWSSIGSINFTGRAMKSNAEANVAIYDRDFAAGLRTSIEADLARAEEFTLEQWRHRSFGERLKECYYGIYAGLF